MDRMLSSQLLPTFGDMPLDRIGRKEVLEWFDRYSERAPGGANHGLGTLRQILTHAKILGHLEINPASGIRRDPQHKFNRFLSRDVANRLHAQLDQLVAERPERAAQADIIRLLCYTGCRHNEIRMLRWCEVHVSTLDLADSKTGPRKVYLNSETRRIIECQPRTGGDYVLPSPSNPSQPVTERTSLPMAVRCARVTV